jgi:hypothetical protein
MLVLAASAGPVRVWTTPPIDEGPASAGQSGPLETIASTEPVAPVRRDDQSSGAFIGQLVGALLIIAFGMFVVWAARAGLWTRPRWRVGQRFRRPIAVLPELPERELAVDVDAARIALSEGTPRNAIVACWMQLERDAAAAGIPRAAAETSAEYVERVLATSSVDPEPIRALAALYREARFSHHELGDDLRARARAALDRVEAGLERGVAVPA